MLTLRTLDFLCTVTIRSSMAVLFAAVGEVLAEQSGVLNLGVEGMMLMGALSGFGAASATQSVWLGVLAAMAAGGLLALLYALFAITLRANQVVCGLSLTILGTGLSSFLGRPWIGRMGPRFSPWPVPVLSHLPILGSVLFTHVPLVYVGLLCVPAAWLLLFQTRPGLHLRAVGEHPEAADTAGIPVNRLRYLWTVTGGMLAGLGGAYLSLAYTPGWKENMSAGQGWIAIAMVIFGVWNPWRAAGGALLFGGINALQFLMEARQITLIPSYILRMLPYLFTIGVLILIRRTKGIRGQTAAPSGLGVPFSRET